MKKLLFYILILILLIGLAACYKSKPDNKMEEKPQLETAEKVDEKKMPNKDIKVTLIELGSVKCVPCRKMQPIISEIEEE